MSDSDLEKTGNKGGKEENQAQREMSEELQTVAKNLEPQPPLESGRSEQLNPINDTGGGPGSGQKPKKIKPKVFTGPNPFQALAEDEEGIAGIQAQVEKERKRTLQERFGEILEGKFDQFPSAKFETELKGADSLTIIKAGQPGELNLHIIVSWTEDGEKKNRTFSLTEDGKMIPDTSARSAWKALSKVGQKTGKDGEKTGGITKELLLDEVLRIAEKVNPRFFVSISGPILRPGERELQEGGDSTKIPKVETENPLVDPRKVDLLVGHPSSLCGFFNEEEGLDGYWGVVYPHCIVLSSPAINNAAYMFVFSELGLPDIDVTGVDFNLRPEMRMIDKQKRDEILKTYWERSLGSLNKTEARKLTGRGVIRKFHSGDWQGNITKAINKVEKRVK